MLFHLRIAEAQSKAEDIIAMVAKGKGGNDARKEVEDYLNVSIDDCVGETASWKNVIQVLTYSIELSLRSSKTRHSVEKVKDWACDFVLTNFGCWIRLQPQGWDSIVTYCDKALPSSCYNGPC